MGIQTADRVTSAAASGRRPDNQQSTGDDVPSEEELTTLFEAAMKRSAMGTSSAKQTPKITKDEEQKFLKAMQEPEFRSLLNEYMKEISDPANRAETEKYLAQLEQEQRVPEDKMLIKPTPGFVVKTRWQTRASSDARKVFVNVCSSDKLQPPSSTQVAATATSKGGTSWSLPYSVGPERMEADKGGSSAIAYDVCFHPRTVLFAQQQVPYRDMVIKTCLDAVEGLLRQSAKDTQGTLSREYHVLRGVKYKSGEPVTMCLSRPKETLTKPTVPKRERLEPTAPIEKERELKTSTTSGSQNNASALIQEVHASQPAKTASSAPAPAPSAPLKTLTYRVIYRGRFEMMDHMQSPLAETTTNRPRELVVEIDFPTHNTAAGIDLDVNETTVQVAAKGYTGLRVTLPYPVLEAKGSAKFDKKARKLVVTLPVQPPPTPQQPTTITTAAPTVSAEVVETVDEQDETVVDETTEEMVEQRDEPVQQIEPVVKTTVRGPPQDDAFARLRETALMVANDPLYLPRAQPSPRKKNKEEEEMAVVPQPTTTTTAPVSVLDDALRAHIASDTLYDDLPPLESCSEDEQDAEEDHVDSVQETKEVVELPATVMAAPVCPPYTVKETALCVSYVINVASIDPSRVHVSYPSSSLSSSSSIGIECTTTNGVVYQLTATLDTAIDEQRTELDVATENMVVIFYKHQDCVSQPATPGVINDIALPTTAPSFQNDLLYELD